MLRAHKSDLFINITSGSLGYDRKKGQSSCHALVYATSNQSLAQHLFASPAVDSQFSATPYPGIACEVSLVLFANKQKLCDNTQYIFVYLWTPQVSRQCHTAMICYITYSRAEVRIFRIRSGKLSVRSRQVARGHRKALYPASWCDWLHWGVMRVW